VGAPSNLIYYSIPILVVSLLLIGVLSDRIIRYVLVISKGLGLSEMAAGFVLLSVVTSLPELSVSALAALGGEAGLSIGNVLGSNVANLTIIIGLAVFFSKTIVSLKGESQKELVQFLFISSVIPLFVVQRGTLSPVLGLVLLILFGYFSFVISRKTAKIEPLEKVKRGDFAIASIKFLVSVGLVILLSKFAVDSAVDIADSVGLATSIIGATVIGLGTSLPELATTIQALKKHLFSMALGNIFGSCITNVTLVLGVSSLLSSTSVNVLAVENIMFYVLLSSLTMWYLVSVNERINRKTALILCLIFFLFVLQQIGIHVLF
jgi:cation:H+ antiporter